MKHKAKKALSLVLALTLVLSLLPEMALPAAAAGSAGILTYQGSGTSDGVVYYLTRKKSSSDFKSGQNYIFVPGSSPKDYLTELPAGSGVLRATSSGRAYRHSSITTYVDVVRRTAGFDGCPCGTLNYNASEYNCCYGGVQGLKGGGYSYKEYTFGSHVKITVNKDGEAWDNATVELYQGSKLVRTKTSGSSGVYDMGYLANGTYSIYVNGEYSEGLTVNAIANKDNVPHPGGSSFASSHNGFEYIIETTAFDKTLNYYTLTANTTLNKDQAAEVSEGVKGISGDPGAISVERPNGQQTKILMSGSGTATRIYKDNTEQWNVLVGGQDTTHHIGNGSNSVHNNKSNEVETVNFYRMKVTLKADRLMNSSEVTLRDADGNLKHILSYDGTESSGNTAVYSLILQEEESTPGTVSSNPTTYYLYVDGQYVYEKLWRVDKNRTITGWDSAKQPEPYETTVTYYTAELPIKKDNAAWSTAEVTLDNGRDHYNMHVDGDSGVYKADVLNNNDTPYAVSVEGVIDTQKTEMTLAQHKLAALDYYSVIYKTYQKKNSIDYEEKPDAYRAQVVRKGDKTVPPSEAFVDGLSFSWYGVEPWKNADGSFSVKEEFDYTNTPIVKQTILYAQFGEPSVQVNELVRTDENGTVSGEGTFFRLANLNISGFANSDTAIKSAQIRMSEVASVKFESVATETTITQGLKQNPLGSGKVATESLINITFNNDVGLSMAAVQDWLRTNVIFTPALGATEKTCKVEVTVSDGILSNGEVTQNTQTSPGTAKKLTGSTSGATLQSGYYYVDENVSYTNYAVGGNGLTIADGATVYIYINENCTLTAQGGNGSGVTGGGAGIYVPAGATLYLMGEGTVNATGGAAGNGANGSANRATARVWDGDPDQVRSGAGGNGGNGGGGAGAGIGGSGGKGGTGGSGGWYRQERADTGYGHANGYNGGTGGAGASGAASGTVYLQGTLQVTATGGGAGTAGAGGPNYRYLSYHGGTNYCANDKNSDWNSSYGGGSGGGGGGGAGGASAPGIGAGGSGGGGGGGGGGGSCVGRKTSTSPGVNELPHGGGGSGGKTISNAISEGTAGANGGGTRSSGNGNWNSTGGYGGAGGAAGAQAASGAVYVADNATLTGTAGNGTTKRDQTNTVNFIGANTATYNLSVVKNVSVPDYTVPDRSHYLLGWQVTNCGVMLGAGPATPLTSAETKLYQPGDSIPLAKNTVGNITLTPILREKTGITASDSSEIKFAAQSAPPIKTSYYTYTFRTTLDGTAADMGPMVLTSGSDVYRLAPGGENLVYSMTVSTNASFIVTSTKYPDSYANSRNLGTVTHTDENKVFAFESILVDVDGYDTEDLALKNGTNGPAMTLTGVENGVYHWRNVRQVNGSNAVYEVYIDGVKVPAYLSSKSTDTPASYGGESKKVTVYYSTITVNVSGNAYVDLIELREQTGNPATDKKDSNGDVIRIVPEAVTKPTDGDGNKDGVWTWAVTKLKDTSSPTYQLYLNGKKIDDLTGDFKKSHTLNTPFYLLTVETKVDGGMADVGAVKIGGEEAARVDTGKYQLLTTSMLARLTTVGSDNVGAIVPPTQPTKTVEYYSVNYTPELVTGTDDSDNPITVKRDNGVYLPGQTTAVQSGVGVTTDQENVWFAGWKAGNTEYAVGDSYTIPSEKTTFEPVWKPNSQAEARWIINGETHYGTLAEAIAAANGTVKTTSTTYFDKDSNPAPEGANVTIYVQNPATLRQSATLPVNTVLIVEEPTGSDNTATFGGNLTVDEGVLLTNYGTIHNNNDMTVKNNGVVLNKYVKVVKDGKDQQIGATFTNTATGDHKLKLVEAQDGKAPGRIINEGIFHNSGNAEIPNKGFDNTDIPKGQAETKGPGGTLPGTDPSDPKEPFGGMVDVVDEEPTIITLNADVTLDDTLEFTSGKWILDLKGHTLSGPSSADGSKPAIKVTGSGTELTIIDTVGGIDSETPDRRAGKIVGGSGVAVTDNDNKITEVKSASHGLEVGSGATVIMEGPAAVYGGNGATVDSSRDGGNGAAAVKLSGGSLDVQYGALIQGGNGGDSVKDTTNTGASQGTGGAAGVAVTGSGTLTDTGESKFAETKTGEDDTTNKTEILKYPEITVRSGKPGNGYTYTPYDPTSNPDGPTTGTKTPGATPDPIGDGDLDRTKADTWQRLSAGQFSLTPAYKVYTGSEQEPDAINFIGIGTTMPFAPSSVTPVYFDDAQHTTGTALTPEGGTAITAPTIGDLTGGNVTISTNATAETNETVKTYYTTGTADPTIGTDGAVSGENWSEYSTGIAITAGTKTTVRAITVKTTADGEGTTTVSYSKIAARTFQLSVTDLLGAAITVKYYKQGENGAETLVETNDNPGKPKDVGVYTVKVTTAGGSDHDNDLYRRPTDGELTIGTFEIVPKPAADTDTVTYTPPTSESDNPKISPAGTPENKTYTVTVNDNSGEKVTGIKIGEETVSSKTFDASDTTSVTVSGTPENGYTAAWTASDQNISFTNNSATFTPTSDVVITVTAEPTPATAPVITSSRGITVPEGYSEGSIEVKVQAAPGGETLSYQWYKGDEKLDSATGATYNLPTDDGSKLTAENGAAKTYQYYCEVTSKRTDNDQTATVKVPVTVIVTPVKDSSDNDVAVKAPSITFSDDAKATISHSNTGDGATYTLYYATGDTQPTAPSESEGTLNTSGWTQAVSGTYIDAEALTATTTYHAVVVKATTTGDPATTTYAVSAVSTATYTVYSTVTDDGKTPQPEATHSAPDVAAPVITFNPASNTNSTTATITCTTEGATIYYTTGTTDLKQASNQTDANKYTDGISLEKYTVVKAIAVKGDKQSTVTTATFVPKDVVTVDPTGTVTPRKPGKTEITVQVPKKDNPSDPDDPTTTPEEIKIEFEVTEESDGTLKLHIPTYTIPYGFNGLTITGATTSGDENKITVADGKITTKSVTETAVAVTNGTNALAKVKVAKRPITVKATDRYLTYGDTTPTTFKDYVVTGGLAAGDTITEVTITSSGNGTTPLVAGTYTLTPGAAAIKSGETVKTNNYNITYTDGTLHVEGQPVTVSGIRAEDKKYDGAVTATLRTKTDTNGQPTTVLDAYVVDGTGEKLNTEVRAGEGGYEFDSPAIGTRKVSLFNDGAYLYSAVDTNYAIGSDSQRTAYGIILRRPMNTMTDNAEPSTTPVTGVGEAEYNGKNQVPAKLTYTGVTPSELTLNTDYTVQGQGVKDVVYDSDGEVTSHPLSINGAGNFTGSGKAQFKITPKDISSGTTITLANGHLIYDGAEQEAVISKVTVSGVTGDLVEGVDYEIVDVTNATGESRTSGRSSVATAVGTYTLTIKGIGNFTGIATTSFTIGKLQLPQDTQGALGVQIAPTPQLTYTGYPQDQKFSVQIYNGSGGYGEALGSGEYFVQSVAVQQGKTGSLDGVTQSGNSPTAKVKNAGEYTATIGFANYDGTVDVDFTVLKVNPQFSIVGEQDGTGSKPLAESYEYGDGKTITLATEYGPETAPTITFEIDGTSDVATVNQNTGVVTFLKAGTVEIKAKAEATDNYNAATDSVTLTIAPKGRTVTVTGTGVSGDSTHGYALTKTYGDAAFTIGKTGSGTNILYDYPGDGTVTITSSNEDVATVGNTGTVTIKGAGEATLTISVEATEKWAAADVQIGLTVNKATVTAKIDPFTKVYDGKTDTTFTDENDETHDLEVYFEADSAKGATGKYTDKIAISGVSGTFDSAAVGGSKTITISEEQAKAVVFSGWPIVDGQNVVTGYTDVALDEAGTKTAATETVGNVEYWKLSGYLRDYDVLIPKTVSGSNEIVKRTAYITVYAQDKIYDATTAAQLRTSVTDDDGRTTDAPAIVIENLIEADEGKLMTSLTDADVQVEFARKNASSLAPVNVKNSSGNYIYQTTFENNGEATVTYNAQNLPTSAYQWDSGFDGSGNYVVKLRGGAASIDPKVIKLTAEGQNREYAKDATYANFKITSPDGAKTNAFTTESSGSATIALGTANGEGTVTLNDAGKALGIIVKNDSTITADDKVTGISASIDDDTAGRRSVSLTLEGADAANYELEYPPFYIMVSKVEAGAAQLTLDITGWKYGEAPNKPVTKDGDTELTSGVRYQYTKKETGDTAESIKNAANRAWSYTVPTDAGSYWVKAVVNTTNYQEKTLYKDFTITKLTPAPVTDTIYYVPAAADEVKNLTHDLSVYLPDPTSTLTVNDFSSSTHKVVKEEPKVEQNVLRYTVQACPENAQDRIVIKAGGTDNINEFTITLDLLTHAVTTDNVPEVADGEINNNHLLAYAVNYALEQLDGTYAKDTEHSGDQYAFLGATVTPVLWSFKGYVTPPAQSQRITQIGQTFTFRYALKRIAVTPDLDGGTADMPETVPFSQPVDKLPKPTREGYDFDGWEITYTDPDDPTNSPKTLVTDKDGKVIKTKNQDDTDANPQPQQPGQPATIPDSKGGITVKAKWTETTGADTYFKVTYASGGATGTPAIPDQKAKANAENKATVTVAECTWTYTGHKFSGWKVGDTDEIVQPGASLTVTANVTLTAQWDVKYTVKHMLQALPTPQGAGHDAPDNYSIEADTEVFYAKAGTQVTPEVKTYTGFTAPATETVAVDANGSTTVTYNYGRNRYTLTRNTNAGSDTTEGNEPTQLYYGEELPTRSRTNWTFLGWFDQPTGGTQVTTMPAQDTTVYAHWIGGTRKSMAVVVNNQTNSNATNITGLSSGEITFDGTNYGGDNTAQGNATNKTLVSTLQSELQTEASSDHYTVTDTQTLTLTMSLDIFGDVGSRNYTEGQQKLVDMAGENADADFYLNDEGAGNSLALDFFNIDIEKKMEGTGTETSKLDNTQTVLEITLDYDITGKLIPNVYRYHGTTAQEFTRLTSKPATPRDGTVWVEEKGGNTVTLHIYSSQFSEFAIGAVDLGSDYYTITFDGNSGTLKGEESLLVRDGLTLEESYFTGDKIPTRSGYTFVGWMDEDGTYWSADTGVSKDTTLTAQWSAPTKEEPDNGGTGGGTGGNGGSGGGSTGGSFELTPSSYDHGDPTVKPTDPKPDDTVKISVKPDKGYQVKDIVVTDEKGNPIPVTVNPDGTFSYPQPNGKVTIDVIYGKELADPAATGVSVLLNTDDHIAYLQGRLNVETGEILLAPDGNITRAETAMVFYRMLRNQNVPVTVVFDDVDGAVWYAEAVNVLGSMGILRGRGEDIFDPDASITRAEFAAIATRFAKSTTGQMAFTDVADDFWAYGNIAAAARYGWIEGYGDGRFGPQDPITRAEAATIVNHMLGRSPDRAYIMAHKSKLKQFPDLQDTKKWYYYEMVEASNDHDHTRKSGVEQWEK